MPSIEQIGHKIVVFFKTFCDIRRTKGKSNFFEKGFFMNIYVSCLLIFLLLNNISLSRIHAEETLTESTETVISETKTDTPLPETQTDTPAPETKTDTPLPETKTDVPVPETQPTPTLTQEAKGSGGQAEPAPTPPPTPAPEIKTVRPTAEIKKEISAPATPLLPAQAPAAKPLKTGDVYMRQGHKEEFTKAVGIPTPANTNTPKAAITPRTEDLKKLQQARVSSAKKTSIPSTTKK